MTNQDEKLKAAAGLIIALMNSYGCDLSEVKRLMHPKMLRCYDQIRQSRAK